MLIRFSHVSQGINIDEFSRSWQWWSMQEISVPVIASPVPCVTHRNWSQVEYLIFPVSECGGTHREFNCRRLPLHKILLSEE